MIATAHFTFAQVRSTFQTALKNCEADIQDHTLPEPCAAVGRLLMQMAIDGVDWIARDQIDGMALSLLDRHQRQL